MSDMEGDIPAIKGINSIDFLDVHEKQRLPNDYTVRTVLYQSEDLLIYQSEESISGFHFHWRNEKPYQRERLTKYNLISNEVSARFKNLTPARINNLLSHAVKLVFIEEDEDTVQAALNNLSEEVKKTSAIKHALASTRNFAVGIDEHGELIYKIKSSADHQKSIAEFERLKSLADVLLSGKQKEKIYLRLGTTLCSALRLSDDNKSKEIFQSTDELIHRAAKNILTINYIISVSLITSTILALLTPIYFITPHTNPFKIATICICGGVLGAFISILERSKEIRISEFESQLLIIIQGIVRVAIGGIFGLIAYFASKSGLALTIFNHTAEALLILGIIAGFSERLIPDMLQSLSKNGENKPS